MRKGQVRRGFAGKVGDGVGHVHVGMPGLMSESTFRCPWEEQRPTKMVVVLPLMASGRELFLVPEQLKTGGQGCVEHHGRALG